MKNERIIQYRALVAEGVSITHEKRNKQMTKQNDLLNCNICNWLWRQRKGTAPKVCPNCKSYSWNTTTFTKYLTKKQIEKINEKRYNEFFRRAKKLLVFKTNKGKTRVNPILLWGNPFPDEVIVNYHHVNDIFVIPIPEKTHKVIPGIKKNHREIMNDLIKKIYCIDLNEILCEKRS